ncbi:MAG: hypothetical protein JSV57_04075 [Candidatus Bathyarchaeota archaeon]|nr:MAG: hypothetical protein JSV57_04075 [Candidatus Bathyarchaeota archaeon]
MMSIISLVKSEYRLGICAIEDLTKALSDTLEEMIKKELLNSRQIMQTA